VLLNYISNFFKDNLNYTKYLRRIYYQARKIEKLSSTKLGLTLDRENMLGSAPPRKFPKSSTEKSEVPMEMEIIQQEVLGEVQLANEKSVMPPSPSPTQ